MATTNWTQKHTKEREKTVTSFIRFTYQTDGAHKLNETYSALGEGSHPRIIISISIMVVKTFQCYGSNPMLFSE